MLSLPRRRWAAWLALLIAVVMVAAPALSRALAVVQTGAYPGIEICTAQGSRWVVDSSVASTDAPSSDTGSAFSGGHCPFCLHTAERCAPPPSPFVYRYLAPSGPPVALVWPIAPDFSQPYCCASPRGPPGAMLSIK
jgi:hypothetical protein